MPRYSKLITAQRAEVARVRKVLGKPRPKAIRACDVTTCGVCGRSWDDGKSTSLTPTPSGRCPFEYAHATGESTVAKRHVAQAETKW